MHLFWGDERYVPRFHPASNYGMAHETFLQRLPIAKGQVHRIPTEVDSPERAAYVYDQIIHFNLRETESEMFDLVLLGLGTDGHTASIFPEHLNEAGIDQSNGDPSSGSGEPWVKAVTAPEHHAPAERITLTLDALNHTRHALFLVSGADKREVLPSILRDTPESLAFPAAHIRPSQQLSWYVDEAAFPD